MKWERDRESDDEREWLRERERESDYGLLGFTFEPFTSADPQMRVCV